VLQPYLQDPSDTTLQQNLLKRVVFGPWDVDNDNDGVRDSVWIDAGLPLVTNAQGKLVKPLVSLLVVDLDGRVNVNVHGSADLADFADGNSRFRGPRLQRPARHARQWHSAFDNTTGPSDPRPAARLGPRRHQPRRVGDGS
jgi:hypothetical protein